MMSRVAVLPHGLYCSRAASFPPPFPSRSTNSLSLKLPHALPLGRPMAPRHLARLSRPSSSPVIPNTPISPYTPTTPSIPNPTFLAPSPLSSPASCCNINPLSSSAACGRSFSGSRPMAKSDATVARATRGRGRKAAAEAEDEDKDDPKMRRLQALENVIKKVNEEYGAGICGPLSSAGPSSDIERFSTGILPLDVALEGGWPRGRVVEIFGHESSGKTTLALYAAAEIQKLGQSVVLIDAEHALDMSYAKKLGVITEGNDRMLVGQPNSGEHAISVADDIIRSGTVSLLIVDSVSALVPQQELEGVVGEGSLGQLARLMSASLRRLQSAASRSGCTIMFLNQMRNKIGAYGNPETTTGGLALKFYASVRCEVRVVERKKIGTEDVGYRARVRVVKSKVSIPYKVAEFDVLHGKGVPRAGALLDVAESLGVVRKNGAYYHIGCLGLNLHGREKSITHLEQNPEGFAELEKKVRARISGDELDDAEQVQEEDGLEDDGDFTATGGSLVE